MLSLEVVEARVNDAVHVQVQVVEFPSQNRNPEHSAKRRREKHKSTITAVEAVYCGMNDAVNVRVDLVKFTCRMSLFTSTVLNSCITVTYNAQAY